MKTMLIRNYAMMIIAWSMVLDGHRIVALIMALLASLLFCIYDFKVLSYKSLAITLLAYFGFRILLYGTNIPYFFPELYVFLFATSINLAFSSYYLPFIKTKFVLKFMLVTIVSIVVLSIIIYFLPEESYIIFSKTSLYLMLVIIFLPYLCSFELCCLYKLLSKKSRNNLHIKNNNSTINVNSRLSRRVVGKSY